MNFHGGNITSDGDIMLLRQVDKYIGLSKAVVWALADNRRQASCTWWLGFVALTGLCIGMWLWRHQWSSAIMLSLSDSISCSAERYWRAVPSSTLCRWENRANRQTAWHIHQVMIERFVGLWQTGRPLLSWHSDHYCFLPLYVFCQDQLLVSYLRSSNIDGAKHAWAILSLLVKQLRENSINWRKKW